MNSGELNHRVSFYAIAQTAVPGGGTEPSRELYYTTNAKVEPLKQDRSELGNQSVLIGGYQIIVRYRRDKYPKKTMIVDYRGKTLSITSIQQYKEDREMLLIIAMECQ